MLSRQILTFGLIALLVPTVATPQTPAYSRAEVDAAINIGVRDRVDRIQHTCTATIGGFWNKLGEGLIAQQGAFGQYHAVRHFRISGQTPLARVARYAADSQRRYEPAPQATDDHIVAMISNDVFTVNVWPRSGGSMVTAARLADTGVEHIVIRPRGDKNGRFTVQPLTLDVAGSTSATNLFGASVELRGVVATFASADVRAIAANNDIEAILITTGGEFKCNLDDTRIKRGYNLLNY